jgi:hypothetical protein
MEDFERVNDVDRWQVKIGAKHARKATVCTGVVLKSCGQKEISAIEQRGNFFEPSESFGSVDSFSGKTCTIRTSSDNVVTAAAMAAKLPSFYTLEGGRQVKIKPDYVQFSCYKR